MKSIGFKTFTLFAIILLQGCMPDSLTKFKQEQKPQKTVTGGSTTQDTAPSALSYTGSPYKFTVSNPIVAQTPTVTGVVNTYSISPAVPAGLLMDTTTGRLSGTPTTFTAPTNYVITATNTAGSTNTTISISSYNQPAGLKYNLSPRAIITMSATGGLSVGGSFTTASGAGTIKQLSGNVAEVEVSTGFFSLGEAVTESTGSAFTIDELDFKNAIQIFPVNTANIANFSVGEYVSTPASQGSSLGVVKQLLSDSIVVDMIRGTFAPTETVDDLTTYSATAMTIDKINFVLDNGDSIDLRPTITAGESIDYILSSGALPSGFSAFEASSGYIIGTYNTSQSTQVTVSAENPVGSNSATFTMGPLIASPQYLSVTQNVILKVLNTSDFEYGKKVSTPDGDLGSVIQVVDSEYLYIKVLEGSFEKDESLDNSQPFGGEKTSVLDLKHVSFVLEVPNGGAANFLKDGYISSDANGLGIVSHIFPDAGNADKIFVRQTFPGFTAVQPGTAINIDNTQTYTASETTIERVRANHLELYVDSVATFSKGMDITYDNAGVYASGWVHDVNASANSLTVNVNREGFHYDADVDNANPFVASEADITSYRADNTIYMVTGKPIRLNTTLLAGNDIAFTITPDLPVGVTLDASTGVISGTPSQSSVKKSYTLTASNTVAGTPQSTTFSFNIKVYDVFSLANITENATSYAMHRLGKGNEIAECMMTQEQINGSNQSAKDITCMLEGGELDIYQLGMNTQIFASKGLCKFTQIRPYGFWQWQYKKTTPNNAKLIVSGECSGGTRTLTNTDGSSFRCQGDYASDEGFGDGPNCDDGSYSEVNISYSDLSDPADGTCDTATITVNDRTCGGKKFACFGGSQKEEFTTTQLGSGIRSTIYPSSDGIRVDYSVASPLNKGLISNRNIVNYTANNTCSTTDNYNYNNESWRSYASTSTARPLTGTIEIPTAYTSTVTGTGTLFTEELVPGDVFFAAGESYVVNSIASDTSLTLANPVVNTVAALTTFSLSPFSDPFLAGSEPFYEFSCLDAAYDTIGRIRMMVREWDRDFKVTDRIDQLTIPLAGTTSNTAGSVTATGVGTAYNTEVVTKRMIQVGSEVNTVDTNIVAGSMDYYLTSVLSQALATAYVRPLLSDSGEATDLFGNFYNNRTDWDDDRNVFSTFSSVTYSATGYYPALNSCGAATAPSQIDSSGGGGAKLRLFDYRFPNDSL